MQSTIQIHNCFWSAIHLSIQSIFWIVDCSNPDSTQLKLMDWSAEWSEALHFLSLIQISLHYQFKTGHMDEITKTKFCLGDEQFPESRMKLLLRLGTPVHGLYALGGPYCTPLKLPLCTPFIGVLPQSTFQKCPEFWSDALYGVPIQMPWRQLH